MECKICKQEKELRVGVCFNCSDAESVIGDGLDLYERGRNGTDTPAKTAKEKLQFLIEKGWQFKGLR